MSSNENPRSLSLSDLQERCAQETMNYLKGIHEETWHCYEVFRRAIVDKVGEAWNVIDLQYRNQMRRWVEQHPRFRDFNEDPDLFVNLAFEKFWRRNFSALEFARFPNVSGLMAYLKTCVWSVIMDHWRIHLRKYKVVYLEESLHWRLHAHSFQETIEKRLEQEDFWSEVRELLGDEVSYQVVYASFALNLKPDDIFKQTPKVFGNIREVYKIKARAILLLDRLLREKGHLYHF